MSDPFNSLISTGAANVLLQGANMASQHAQGNQALAQQRMALDQQNMQFMLQLDASRRQEGLQRQQLGMQQASADRAYAAQREESAFARLNGVLDRQLKMAEVEAKDRQLAFENTLRAQSFDVDMKLKTEQVKQMQAATAAAALPGEFEMLTAAREATGDLQDYHIKLGALIAKNPLAYGMLKRTDPATYEAINSTRRATALATRDVLDFDALQLGEITFSTNEKFDAKVHSLDLVGSPQIGNTSAAPVRLAELAGIDLRTAEDPGGAILGYVRENYPGATGLIRQLEDPKIRQEFNDRAAHGVYVVPTKEQSLRYAEIIESNRRREVETLSEMEANGVPVAMMNKVRDSYAQERQDSWYAIAGVQDPEAARLANPGAALLDSTLEEMKGLVSKHRLVRDIPYISNVGGAARAGWAALTGAKPNQLDVDRAKGLGAGLGMASVQLATSTQRPIARLLNRVQGSPVDQAQLDASITQRQRDADRMLVEWQKSGDPQVAGYRESVSYDTLERATLDYQDALNTAQYAPGIAPQDRMAIVHEAAKRAINAAISYGVPETVAHQRYAPQRFLNPGMVKDDMLLPVRAMVEGTTPLALMRSATKNPALWEQSNQYFIERWAANQRAQRLGGLQAAALQGVPASSADPFGGGFKEDAAK